MTRKSADSDLEPTGENKSTAQLKNITLKNGKLIKKFAKDNYTYDYKKRKNFSYEFEKINEEDTVKVVEKEDAIYFIVESPEGLTNVYCLHLQTTNSLAIILIILIVILTMTNITTPIIMKNRQKIKKA